VVSLTPHPSATIYDLKSEICDIEGIPPREQILMLGEKELENCGTCAEIGDSNTLQLLFGNLSLGISGLVSADPRRIWAPSSLELDIDYQRKQRPKIWNPLMPRLINESPSEALSVSGPGINEISAAGMRPHESSKKKFSRDVYEEKTANYLALESSMTAPQSGRLTNGPTM
jgi:hypothetical protein